MGLVDALAAGDSGRAKAAHFGVCHYPRSWSGRPPSLGFHERCEVALRQLEDWIGSPTEAHAKSAKRLADRCSLDPTRYDPEAAASA